MSNYEFGRSALTYKSGKTSDPCDNCGKINATMYELGLSKEVGDDPHIKITLCVICRSHVEGLFRKHSQDWNSVCY